VIEVSNIRVRSFDLDRMDLWWEFHTTSEDLLDYDIYILRSGSPLGPYDQICGPLLDVGHFSDIQGGLLNSWRHLYYRIKLVHRQTGASQEFPDNNGATSEAPLPLDAMEAARIEEVLFREHIGRPAWLFKKRSFGPRCPHCWDERMQRATTRKCQACYGGTFIHGYMAPIRFYVQIDPAPKSDQVSSVEEMQEQHTAGRCIFFPPLDPDDLIVELENLRWRVTAVTATRRLRSPIHQELELRMIPKGHIEYAIPMPNVDLENFPAYPEREFTNPQNLTTAVAGQQLDMQTLKDVYRWKS